MLINNNFGSTLGNNPSNVGNEGNVSNEKAVLYSMIEREIDNILARFAPGLLVFSGTIKKKVHSFIDPLVSQFMEGDTLRTDIAGEFALEKATNSIEEFKKRFKQKTEQGGKSNEKTDG